MQLIRFLNKTLIASIGIVLEIFINFYIWEQHNEILEVLYFNLALFLTIPIASYISGLVSENLDPKVSVLLGNWIQILQITLLISTISQFDTITAVSVGLLGGLAFGFRTIGSNFMFIQGPTTSQSNEKWHANKALGVSLIALAIPVIFAYLIETTGTFIILFQITIFALLVSSLSILIVKDLETDGLFKLKKIFTFPGTNADKGSLVKATFLDGIEEGVTLTIVPIIVLNFFEGSILSWSILNTGLVLLSILFTLLLSLSINQTKSKLLFIFGAFAFAGVNIFSVTKVGPAMIIIFITSLRIMMVIREISYKSALLRISHQDRTVNNLHVEYVFIDELFKNLGRFSSVFALLLFGISLQDEIVVRLILAVVSLLPIIILTIFGQTRIFNPRAITDVIQDAGDIKELEKEEKEKEEDYETVEEYESKVVEDIKKDMKKEKQIKEKSLPTLDNEEK